MKRRMIFSAPLLLFIIFANSGISLGAPQDVIGTWSVTGQIVTTCSLDEAQDPNALQPGSLMAPQIWTIADSANGPILTSDKGSVTGQYTANGAVFQFDVTLASDPSYGRTDCLTQIECYADSPTSMYGTVVNHFIQTIYITGATFERCNEAIQFRATK
jgi:hypothetical protein